MGDESEEIKGSWSVLLLRILIPVSALGEGPELVDPVMKRIVTDQKQKKDRLPLT